MNDKLRSVQVIIQQLDRIMEYHWLFVTNVTAGNRCGIILRSSRGNKIPLILPKIIKTNLSTKQDLFDKQKAVNIDDELFEILAECFPLGLGIVQVDVVGESGELLSQSLPH